MEGDAPQPQFRETILQDLIGHTNVVEPFQVVVSRMAEPVLRQVMDTLAATAALPVSDALVREVSASVNETIAASLDSSWSQMVEAAVAIAAPAGFRWADVVTQRAGSNLLRRAVADLQAAADELAPSLPRDVRAALFGDAAHRDKIAPQPPLAAESRSGYRPEDRAAAQRLWSTLTPAQQLMAILAFFNILAALLPSTLVIDQSVQVTDQSVHVSVTVEEGREPRTLAEMPSEEVDELVRQIMARIEAVLSEARSSD